MAERVEGKSTTMHPLQTMREKKAILENYVELLKNEDALYSVHVRRQIEKRVNCLRAELATLEAELSNNTREMVNTTDDKSSYYMPTCGLQ